MDSNQTNRTKLVNITSPTKFKESFFEYSIEVITDIVFGIFLGVLVNLTSDYMQRWFNLSLYAKCVVQILFIIIVLYFMELISPYLYRSREDTSYGIIFTLVFIAVQPNMSHMFGTIFYDIKSIFHH